MKDALQRVNKTLWFAISCKTIGGAERRILNLATQVLQLNPNLNVNFLITPELYSNYCSDGQLKPILESSKIKIHLTEWPPQDVPQAKAQKLSTSPASRIFQKGVRLTQKILNRLIRSLPAVSPKTASNNSVKDFDQLQRASWYEAMLKQTSPGDHVHCLVAHIERNGGILLSQQGRTVVAELTSNRALEQSIPELRCILSRIGPCPNLHIQCISQTVYQNFINSISADFLEEYQISCDYYKTACLPLDVAVPDVPPPRENIIVFGHRFVGPKNGLLFAKTIAQMHRQGELKNWKVHFRGFGPEEEAIRSILESQIADQTVDLGWTSDLEGELQRSKVFVSIIATGSYPSQSVFQAMRNGNLLVLGDAGETAKHFGHHDVYLTAIEQQAIRSTLISAMNDASNPISFTAKSREMKQFFRTFSEESTQAKELLNLHFSREAQESITA